MIAVRRVLVALFGGFAFAPAIASAEPPLYLPWTCDEVHHVTNGHQTSSHTGNDAWAWDFGLAEGTQVHAAADGVVRLVKMDSNQGGCDAVYANDANYVVVDFDDGTEALYMHLAKNSSTFHVGDEVKQGDLVGKVGLTGWVCGAHLHFQVQNTCDSWWCQSKHAEFVDFGDPDEDVDMASNNCPVVEPCPLVLDGTTTTIDDSEGRCFHRVSSWFWPGEGGWEDGHVYTWANDLAEPDTIGRWDFGVEVPGRYRVEAYVPAENAGSQLATYEIQTGEAMVEVGPFDQSTQKEWVVLGAFDFVAGDEHWVRLRDNTGESRDLDRALAFDAIRLSWEPESSGDSSDSGGGDGSDDGTPPPSDDDDGGATAASADDGGGSSDDGPALPPASEDDGDGGGCAIAEPRSSGLVLLLLGLVARVRSRARARAEA